MSLVNQPLPADPVKRAQQLYWLNDLLLKFVIAQGGATVAAIRAEYLMDYGDYCVYSRTINKSKSALVSESAFDVLSEQSWLDFVLQTYKCLVLPKALKKASPLKLTSNVYSDAELILLNWLNEHYEDNRSRIWANGASAPRWIVNFDFDLMDGLVLGAVLAAYAPYMTHEVRTMHPDPASSEECLHNGLGVAFRFRLL